MMSENEIRAAYRQDAERAAGEVTKTQRLIYRTGTLRLLLFGGAVAAVIGLWGQGALMYAVTAACLLPFLLLVKYHNRLFLRKDYQEKRQEVNRQELAALDQDTSAFDDGKEFADPAHPYTYDLDVFGPRSLFQYVNRTCTRLGREQLAGWMACHLDKREPILRRQEAVQELAGKPSFRQHFRILGLLNKGQAADRAELLEWAQSPVRYRNRGLLRRLPHVVTAVNLLCLLGVVTGVLPGNVWGVLWFGIVVASFAFTRQITKVQSVYGQKLRILGTYAQLLQTMDEEPMEAPLLRAVKDKIGGDRRQASQAIRRLVKLMNELDQRNNYLMYTVLNGCFFWELWQIMRIEAWKEVHAGELPHWLEAIGEMDALCSLGTFAYNHPEGYSYPDILGDTNTGTDNTETPFQLVAETMGHPLIPRDRCVCNDIRMTRRPAFIIITGANMAGKSTYLRTIGVNYLLACIGAPVCAKQMSLYPARLMTSLRTTDSLSDNESYFFAELKRLKSVIDRLQSGEQLFIILDEILKGTNSADKQRGSFALVQQLVRLRANGIIATHDLLLGTLKDRFPDCIDNFRFEADITGDELTFSYRLRPGVAQNMNACFLMKKMGIAMDL
ncbi:MutS family DNA mismatch repair protein [Mediterranea massiliensis]|uniref:MutS family DNA mismatch repair protein n=1 Tax=Mediterranea massiliensis TaxID=1841865 RepID=UPI0023F398A4|nr:MutS family DNA mismatch repair protein [Mediterranea massiliensis]